jgi:NADH dehydrogenase
MSDNNLHVVTGAFGYSGSHIADRLLKAGARVRTLTGHPERPHPLQERVEARRLAFDDPAALTESLRGARVLYNTYWVRFDHGDATHQRAVDQLRTLIRAAADAGVQRVVHTSITNPSADSPLPYFRGKAQVEAALKASGLSYAILRPAVFFGGRDVLINNIAYLLRRFPVFGIPGKGDYGIQPIHVEDMARLAVEQGRSTDDVVLDAVGPETYSYRELVRTVARAIGKRRLILRLPAWLVLAVAKVVGWFVKDNLLTADEVNGLRANLLVSADPPTGTTRFSEWLADHAHELGVRYANEITRHYR